MPKPGPVDDGEVKIAAAAGVAGGPGGRKRIKRAWGRWRWAASPDGGFGLLDGAFRGEGFFMKEVWQLRGRRSSLAEGRGGRGGGMGLGAWGEGQGAGGRECWRSGVLEGFRVFGVFGGTLLLRFKGATEPHDRHERAFAPFFFGPWMGWDFMDAGGAGALTREGTEARRRGGRQR